MRLMKVSGISKLCLMCFAMTDAFPSDQSSWIGTASAATHVQEEKHPDAKAKVYTNDDLSSPAKKKPPKSDETNSVEKPGHESAKSKSAPKDSRASSALDSYRDAQGHDRSYWQKKIRPLRAKVDSLDLQMQSLKEKQANTNVTTGLKVSGKGHLHASDSTTTQARKMEDLKQKRALVLKSIQEVEEDARKAQALPEWLR